MVLKSKMHKENYFHITLEERIKKFLIFKTKVFN